MSKRVLLLPLSAEFTPVKKEDDINLESFISLLPKNIRNKGSVLLHAIKDAVTFDSNGRIIYRDGTLGSSVFDHIKYWCSIGAKKVFKDVWIRNTLSI